MDIRNAQFNSAGTIDCEIDHPRHGWIPFTADPNDAEPLGAQVFDAVKDTAAAYIPPPEPTPEEILAAERAEMSCRAASMRRVLHRMDLLAQVQAIADSDPEASIVWEYETVYKRNDPFVEALGVEAFTPEQIDDLFREAMKL